MSEHCYDKFLRLEKLPNIWCPGCGNGVVLQALLRAVEDSGVNPDKVVVVSGIGCSARASGYLSLNGIHTIHGRAIAFATGIKLANPELKVVVITGDGDCMSIGCNHLIHAARRNIDMTVVVFNNSNYGMTGGQFSATTPRDAYSKTSVYGNIERRADVCGIAMSAGASYVARSTTYHAQQLRKYIGRGIAHEGFSVVEAMCDCPTLFGRLNGRGDGARMMAAWKEVCVPFDKAADLYGVRADGKLQIGEFVEQDGVPEYCRQYAMLRERAMNDEHVL